MAALCASTAAFSMPWATRHDVDVAELRAALAPVGVGHDVVPADLAAGLDFPPGGTAQ